MSGKELLNWLDVLLLAVSAAVPGSQGAVIAARLASRIIQSLRDLLDNKITEADLVLPSYEEQLAQWRAEMGIKPK